MPSYQMGFETFLNEVKRFKLNSDSLFRIKKEEKKKYFIFYFVLPQTQEEYVATIRKEDFSEIYKSELDPISISAERVNEHIKSAKIISDKLEETRPKQIPYQEIKPGRINPFWEES